MTTARDVIEGALRLIRVQDPAESASSDQAADGLSALNAMLGSWNTEPQLSWFERDMELPLTGATSYTIGPGGDLDTTRPLKLNGAYVRQNGSDYPVRVRSDRLYQSITDKDANGRPELVQYDADYPLGTLYVWPVGGSSYTLYLSAWKMFPTYTNLSDSLSLPPGYERAIRYNLAVELAPEYGASLNQAIVERAEKAKAGIKRMNHTPGWMHADPATMARGGGRYSIYSDT